ncbi:MAG: hypothetical protein ACI4D2_03815 [Lachnospiraceae bacterium]
MKDSRRKFISFLEAFISPLWGLLFQVVLYFLMGVDIKEVSLTFVIVSWVVVSAATAIAFERLERG